MVRKWLTILGLIAMSASASACNSGSQTTGNQPSSKAVSHPKSKAAVPISKMDNSKSPLPCDILIADRGNNRLLIVTPNHKVVWSMTLPSGGPHNQNSLGADDAFFTPDGKHIIINEEDNQMLAVIDIALKKIVRTFGHAGRASGQTGYLNTPDDAYMLPNGDITVADIKNQRILFINQSGKVIKQYGITDKRLHNPPYSFAAPNGDTPLQDGGMMVTEIGGSYADRLNKNGKLLYSVHFKGMPYPSDTQLLPNGNLLVADYETPGRVEEVSPSGKVVWSYEKTSGSGELKNPSLAVDLPNGNILLNDDYNDRVVVINPHLGRIVWQYGHTGVAGTKDGYLNTPDGLDLVSPNVHLT